MLLKQEIAKQAEDAKTASRKMAGLSIEARNSALLKMAEALEKNQAEIISVNAEDVEILSTG